MNSYILVGTGLVGEMIFCKLLTNEFVSIFKEMTWATFIDPLFGFGAHSFQATILLFG